MLKKITSRLHNHPLVYIESLHVAYFSSSAGFISGYHEVFAGVLAIVVVGQIASELWKDN